MTVLGQKDHMQQKEKVKEGRDGKQEGKDRRGKLRQGKKRKE